MTNRSLRRGAIALAPLFSALLCTTAAEAQTYVVAVGNNFGRSQEPQLKYAEDDAERMARVMRDLGRVQPEQELILRGADAGELRNALLKTNAEIRSSEGGGSKNALIVYYSGHADASGLHLGDSTLEFDELKTIVESSPARMRVLIIDSCRSGDITQVKGVRPAEAFVIHLENKVEVEGLAIITSSAGSEDSQESDALRASFFTHHFVNALRGAADRDRDGKITIAEAYGYAYQETLRSSGRTLHLQHPTYAYDLRGKGEFPMTILANGTGRFGALNIAEPGSYLVFENERDGLLAAEIFVADEGARLLLAPGKYFAQRRASTAYREYELQIERDRTVALDDLPYREVTYSRLLRKGGGAREAIHSLTLLGGAHGPVLDGYGIAPTLALGYGLDLSELSVGGQLRLSRSASNSDAALASTALEIGGRLRADRYFDLHWVDLSFGVVADLTWVRQSFTTNGTAPDRSALVFGFGAMLGIEWSWNELLLRLEGGPLTYLLREVVTSGGAVSSDVLSTPVTYSVGLGVGWRF